MKHILLLLFMCICFSQVIAQSVTPVKNGGSKFSITCANMYFEVDSARGARISSFKINELEILHVASATTDMVGSTFWPSPQSVWGWPPAVNLDSKPFTSTIKGNRVQFKGATDPKSQLRFYKSMMANESDTSIILEYVMKNENSKAQSWAPWEITRVEATGLTVFSRGSGSVTGDMKSRTSEVNGYVWYDQDTANSPGNKFFCDGKGWIAHVTSKNNLFIKKFENIAAAKAAPGEAEVEVYTDSNDLYSEIEDQGAYSSIAGKDSVTWKVKWYARALSAKVEVKVGSPSLTRYIESILALDKPLSAGKLNDRSASVKLYPNPASDRLVIEPGLDAYQNVGLKIVNLQGLIVHYQAINRDKTIVDIRKLAPGVYLYELKGEATILARGRFSVVR